MYASPTGIIIRCQLRPKFFLRIGQQWCGKHARGAPEEMGYEGVGCNYWIFNP